MNKINETLAGDCSDCDAMTLFGMAGCNKCIIGGDQVRCVECGQWTRKHEAMILIPRSGKRYDTYVCAFCVAGIMSVHRKPIEHVRSSIHSSNLHPSPHATNISTALAVKSAEAIVRGVKNIIPPPIVVPVELDYCTVS